MYELHLASKISTAASILKDRPWFSGEFLKVIQSGRIHLMCSHQIIIRTCGIICTYVSGDFRSALKVRKSEEVRIQLTKCGIDYYENENRDYLSKKKYCKIK